ncbi:MAG: hypothetical protein LC772_04345, partial [Chloroflexi bacterium]|nr:hypothetical protein [Chloroflexota bacterium]
TDQYNSKNVAAWHAAMGDYLEQHDPYQHLRTTSVWIPAGDPALDRLPELDFVQTHAYDENDFATFIPRTEEQKKIYGKPHWFGEFGVGYANENGTNLPPRESDPTGIGIHNGAWASLMSGCAGTAMVWYWDDMVDPLNLYHIYQPVARFVASLPLQKERSAPLRLASWSYRDPQSTSSPATVEFHGGNASWDPSPQNEPHTFAISSDGVLSDSVNLPGILHGMVNHKNLHNPATFQVDYPAAGTFGVQVQGVSGYGGAALEIDLDGAPVIKQTFTDTNPPGQHITLTQYNKLYSVDVPAGKHTIRVTNEGADWATVGFSATTAFVRRAPNLAISGLQFRNSAILWLRSPLYTWRDQFEKKPLPVQPAGVLVLNGFRSGRYRITWMDTHSGDWQPAQTVTARDGKLALVTPAVAADIAARIDRE